MMFFDRLLCDISTKSFQLTDCEDAHFKLLPILNELSDNFLLGLDLKIF